MLSLKMLNHKLRLKMGEYDKHFEEKYQKFIDTLSKQADDYLASRYGVNEDKDSEEEKPICTTNEFKDVCKELGLEED